MTDICQNCDKPITDDQDKFPVMANDGGPDEFYVHDDPRDCEDGDADSGV